MATMPTGSSGAVPPEAWLRAVAQAMQAGDMARAMAIADEATAKGADHPNLLTMAGYRRLNAGDGDTALARFTAARAKAPHSADVLNGLGFCLTKLGRAKEALPVFDAGIRQSPALAQLHFNKGCALEDLSLLAPAERSFRRAIDLKSDHAAAYARLANLAAQRGDYAAARDTGAKALAFDPRETVAMLALATADVGERKYDSAKARLNALLKDRSSGPINRAIAQSLLGDTLDGLDETDAAFANYSAANALLRSAYAPVFAAPGMESALARAKRLAVYFADLTLAWPVPSQAARPQRAHVFLVGFPRSGTTLLEQVLAGHPDVESLEERDCLIDAVNDFILPPDGLAKFATLDDASLESYRKVYWARVGEAGFAPGRKVFIDKLPLNSVLLCLVARLFPRAKVLFAIRDPRDVAFSCFRRRFGMNAQMYEFTALDSSAAYYDAVMALSALYREKLALDLREVRHEALLAGFDCETREICDFLGITWNETMRDFASRARERRIDTPSAAQLTRGLSRDGAGQWKRYAKHLLPVVPLLAPWVLRFGYEQGQK